MISPKDISSLCSEIYIDNNSDCSILCIHGFSSTPLSIKPLIDAFSNAGFNVYAPILSGHGKNWQALNGVKHTDWINDVEKAYQKIRTKSIFLVGFSMGGTLASIIAAKHKEIKGVILINHAIFINDPRTLFLPFFKKFIKTAKGVAGDIKKKGIEEIAYEKVTTESVYELLTLIKKAKVDQCGIESPVLIFKSKADHIVKFKSANYTFKNIKSKYKELVILKNSYHVATLDNDVELINNKSLDFVKRFK